MKTRILHVVGGMNRGGVETWLMSVMRQKRDRISMDFLVHTAEPCVYDAEILELGGRIIPCLSPNRPWQYAQRFHQIVRSGAYDVVHSHVHHYSGYVLRLAEQAGVPIRIAHSHNNTQSVEMKRGLPRQWYLNLMKQWIEQHATLKLACSQSAAIDLFNDRDYQILPYGVDLEPFQAPIDSRSIRCELGIPSDAFVIGHVGRFDYQKNHSFLLRIMAEIVKRDRSAWLLLVGVGELRSQIEQIAEELELSDRVTFAGSRPDVPRLMRGAMDVFVFPSHYEGLGLVLIEAQAAGLPCVVSDVIPAEVEIVPGLLDRKSSSEPASSWAEIVLSRRNLTIPNALETVYQSSFNIQTAVDQLEKLYGEFALQEAIA
jgi:glycosyltransferase involved in cell wall biosynthesis